MFVLGVVEQGKLVVPVTMFYALLCADESVRRRMIPMMKPVLKGDGVLTVF